MLYNFTWGTKLAVEQDELLTILNQGNIIPLRTAKVLEKNIMVKIASIIAPGNLVVRQWCLIDIIKKSPDHKDKIIKMMDLLSYKGTCDYRLHSEGYSYLVYIMNILNKWIAQFESSADLSELKEILHKINFGFYMTSYLRNNIFYPAPFGDLRDVPLGPEIPDISKLIKDSANVINISNIKLVKSNDGLITYYVKAIPLGFNNHIPKKNYSVNIVDGYPNGFEFYIGYDKKYKNKFYEFIDTFDIRRIISLFFMNRSKYANLTGKNRNT